MIGTANKLENPEVDIGGHLSIKCSSLQLYNEDPTILGLLISSFFTLVWGLRFLKELGSAKRTGHCLPRLSGNHRIEGCP